MARLFCGFDHPFQEPFVERAGEWIVFSAAVALPAPVWALIWVLPNQTGSAFSLTKAGRAQAPVLCDVTIFDHRAVVLDDHARRIAHLGGSQILIFCLA